MLSGSFGRIWRFGITYCQRENSNASVLVFPLAVRIVCLASISTCFLAIYAETKACFVLETDVTFSTTPCNYTWFFSASNFVWFLNFILCSTKIDRFSLPWQDHTLKIEPTTWSKIHGTVCFSRVTIPWCAALYLGHSLTAGCPFMLPVVDGQILTHGLRPWRKEGIWLTG